MPKCARCGCPNPQQTPDPHQLGLCQQHNNLINQPAPRTKQPRQHPTLHAKKLLDDIVPPDQSLRTAAQKTGLSKDNIQHIRTLRWAHVRSRTWEILQEAWAQHQYQNTYRKQDPSCKETLTGAGEKPSHAGEKTSPNTQKKQSAGSAAIPST